MIAPISKGVGWVGLLYRVPKTHALVGCPLALPIRRFATPAPQPDAATKTSQTIVKQPARGLGGKVLRVEVSENAAARLRNIMKMDNTPDIALRIKVESGGCHGFQYIFDLDDKSQVTDKDSIFERSGATVVVDHNSLQVLRDSTVDYTTELIGSQFKVTSPHTSSSCGCGTSFSVEPE